MNKLLYLAFTILACTASSHYAMDKQKARKERKDLVGDLQGQVHDLQQENRALHDQHELLEHSIYLLRQQNQQLLHRIHDQQNNNHKLEQENKMLRTGIDDCYDAYKDSATFISYDNLKSEQRIKSLESHNETLKFAAKIDRGSYENLDSENYELRIYQRKLDERKNIAETIAFFSCCCNVLAAAHYAHSWWQNSTHDKNA